MVSFSTMDNWLTVGLNPIEFKKIVVNADNEPVSAFLIAKKVEQESKQNNFQGDWNLIKSNLSMIPQIYSIKVVTDVKTENDIIRLVKEKIGIFDDVEIWNQMMWAITRFSVSTDHQIQGKNSGKQSLNLHLKTNENLNW